MNYLTPEQNSKLRRWERWNRGYFIVAFIALVTVLVFGSQLGLSSSDSWDLSGVLIVLLIAPIVALQLKLTCPACGQKIGWQAKLMAPDQCPHCHTFLRSRKE
jgi:Mn2+/Fe2+ NRAMP family transporter